MKDITDTDYAHAKRDCKDFKIKSLETYNNYYVQSKIILLADVFANVQNMCLKIYELDPTRFLNTPRLVREVLKKKK